MSEFQAILEKDDYILAVEDSMVQARMLRNFLDYHGLANKMCSNAEEALLCAEANPPVLVISDIVMPGKDGYQLCALLKSHPLLKKVPVILLTSLSDPLDIIKGLQAGADNFITKPYQEQELYSRITDLLVNRKLKSPATEGEVTEVVFRGGRYSFRSDQRQVLNLLLSVYEAAIQRNEQLISTQRELETSNENLKAANQELEAFSYTVSHDLRSPLNVVAGYAQLTMEEYNDVLLPEGREYLERILNSTFAMSRLIEDLLNFSRSARLAVSPVTTDLSAMAEEIISEHRMRDPGFRAEVMIQPGIMANADRGLIHVALTNLLGNAVKYSSKESNPVIIFDSLLDESGVIYYVRDNGAGFDMAKADKLFSPFQRLHSSHEFQGTGVGLATVKRIIERHGGRIWANSKPGEGSSFFFTLGT